MIQSQQQICPHGNAEGCFTVSRQTEQVKAIKFAGGIWDSLSILVLVSIMLESAFTISLSISANKTRIA